jgi:propionyl-CoA carboxylase alpha chain
MREALDRYIIRGVSHNIAFLSALMVHPRFIEGRMSTNMIGEEYPDGFHPGDLPHGDPARIVAVAAAISLRFRQRSAQITGQLPGHERVVGNDWVVMMNGEHHPVTVKSVDGGQDVDYRGQTIAVRSDWQFGDLLFVGTVNGEEIAVQVERNDLVFRLAHAGSQSEVMVLTPRVAALYAHMPTKVAPDMTKFVLSPMPGLLVSVAVQAGQAVKAGEELAVVEAMKMENTLRALRDGVVSEVFAKPGQSLTVDQKILEFE